MRDAASDLGNALRASEFARSNVLHQPPATVRPSVRPVQQTQARSTDEDKADRILRQAQAEAESGHLDVRHGPVAAVPVEHQSFLPLDSSWSHPHTDHTKAAQGGHEGGHLAQPLPLAPMLQRRCNTCMSRDLPGVLLSPNPAPFALLGPQLVPGTQAQLTWGTAKWTRKDCRFRHLLPSLFLFRVSPNGEVSTSLGTPSDGSATGGGSLWACISNPRDTDCTIELHDAAGIEQALGTASEPAARLTWLDKSGQSCLSTPQGGTRVALLHVQGKDEYGDSDSVALSANAAKSVETAGVRAEPSGALIRALESVLSGHGRRGRYDPRSMIWVLCQVKSASGTQPAVVYAAITACYSRDGGQPGAVVPLALRFRWST